MHKLIILVAGLLACSAASGVDVLETCGQFPVNKPPEHRTKAERDEVVRWRGCVSADTKRKDAQLEQLRAEDKRKAAEEERELESLRQAAREMGVYVPPTPTPAPARHMSKEATEIENRCLLAASDYCEAVGAGPDDFCVYNFTTSCIGMFRAMRHLQ